MKEQLVNFIKNNELNFNTTGSGLNSTCVIISGYGLHLGVGNTGIIKEAINELFPKSVGNYEKELERVFNYANTSGYGNWWSKPEAKKMYKF